MKILLILLCIRLLSYSMKRQISLMGKHKHFLDVNFNQIYQCNNVKINNNNPYN